MVNRFDRALGGYSPDTRFMRRPSKVRSLLLTSTAVLLTAEGLAGCNASADPYRHSNYKPSSGETCVDEPLLPGDSGFAMAVRRGLQREQHLGYQRTQATADAITDGGADADKRLAESSRSPVDAVARICYKNGAITFVGWGNEVIDQ